MNFKKAESEELDKTVVTFYKNKSKEILKHTVNYFKKQNILVRTIDNIVAKYRKHNSTSYLTKGPRPKNVSGQQLQTLVKLVNNRMSVSQSRLGRRFGLVNQQLVVI